MTSLTWIKHFGGEIKSWIAAALSNSTCAVAVYDQTLMSILPIALSLCGPIAIWLSFEVLDFKFQHLRLYIKQSRV